MTGGFSGVVSFLKYKCAGVIFLGLLCFMTAPSTANATSDPTDQPVALDSPLEFVLLNPNSDHSFWRLFEETMKAACQDLGCSVESYHADRDQFKMIDQVHEIGRRVKKPDAVFFQSLKKNGPAVLEALEKYEITGFLINAGLDTEQAKTYGGPRERYEYWVGQMVPDDYNAGKTIAKALYRKAVDRGYYNNGKIQFLGILGTLSDSASIERERGLRDFINLKPDAELLQTVEGKWSAETSEKIMQKLMVRYPDVKLVWAASDSMANGVIKACEASKRECDILTVGVDWERQALENIKRNKLLGSAGGHYMEAGWATVLMFDYLKGYDFKEYGGVTRVSKMDFLNRNMVLSLSENCCEAEVENFDFKTLSRFYNPENTTYDFDTLEVIGPKRMTE